MDFKEITDKMYETYLKKNSDYGNSFNDELDEDGLIISKVHLKEKYNRFAQLMKKDPEVAGESIEDTLLDLANYCILTLMWLKGKNSSKAPDYSTISDSNQIQHLPGEFKWYTGIGDNLIPLETTISEF